MPQRVEFTPEQLQLGDDIVASLAKVCPNTEQGLALLAHAITCIITQTVTDESHIPAAVTQVVECLRFNSHLAPNMPTIDAEELGTRHQQFTLEVLRAMRDHHKSPAFALDAIRTAGASYRHWFNQRGVDLYFRPDAPIQGKEQ